MGKKIRFSHFLYGVCGLIVSGSVAYPQTIEGDFKAYPNSVAPLPPRRVRQEMLALLIPPI